MGDAEVTEFLPACRPHGNSSPEAFIGTDSHNLLNRRCDGAAARGNFTPAAASRYIVTVVQLKLGAAPSARTGHIAGLAPLPRDPRALTVRVGGDARPKKRR
jgi:hypothetical protein